MRICQPPILRGELLVSGPVIQVPLFSFYGVTYIIIITQAEHIHPKMRLPRAPYREPGMPWKGTVEMIWYQVASKKLPR